MSGTYVSVTPSPTYARMLAAYFKDLPAKKAYKPSSYHVTLMYSRKTIPEAENFVDTNLMFDADIVGVDWFLGHDKEGYMVALLKSYELDQRHRFWTAMGGEHTYTPYKPHITLASGISKDLFSRLYHSRVTMDPMPILLGDEKVQPIIENWKGSTRA